MFDIATVESVVADFENGVKHLATFVEAHISMKTAHDALEGLVHDVSTKANPIVERLKAAVAEFNALIQSVAVSAPAPAAPVIDPATGQPVVGS